MGPVVHTSVGIVRALRARDPQAAAHLLMAQDWPDGLRNTHFRLLSLVPASGATITDMSTVLYMTKQAVGQFVAQLQDSGHLEVRIDARDRRRRLVVRTPLGDEVVERVNAIIAALAYGFNRGIITDLLRELCREAELVVAVSDWSRDRLRATCPDSADKIVRVYNGIDVTFNWRLPGGGYELSRVVLHDDVEP